MAAYTLTRLATLLALALPSACKPIDVAASSAGEAGPTVTVDEGILAGTSTSLPWAVSPDMTVSQFLGIRFASPVERFAPPQPASAWEGVYDASKYGATCIQQFSYPEKHRQQTMQWFNTPPPPTVEDEDCLFVNVFAPTGAADASKAVMFWIYGGGFGFGSGALPQYDGSSFAANQDVVVVTFNYRTNIFGFPGAPNIPREKQNLGLLDQRLALDWVRRNIHAFGGDPDRITIFGESAGGSSVDALITSPPQPVPFVAAIIQSAAQAQSDTDKLSASSWGKVVSEANCSQADGFECLVALPADTLKRIVEEKALPFFPVHDGGVTWADEPGKERLQSKENPDSIAQVPLLIGSNSDEGSLYVRGDYNVEGNLNNSLSPATPSSSLIAPNSSSVDRNDQLSKLFTELVIQCPASKTAKDSKEVGIPTWRYLYDASFPNTEIFPGAGAYHSSEIVTVFGTFPREGATAFQLELSRYMQKAWADFAKNPSNGPGWEQTPDVAVLGKGATPGESDENRKLMTLQPSSEVDPNCQIYSLLFKVIEPFF